MFVLVMAFCVWLAKHYEKASEEQRKFQAEYMRQMAAEREDRLASMEEHMRECDTDRRELRKELLRLAIQAGNDNDEFPRDPPTVRSVPVPLSADERKRRTPRNPRS